MNSPEWSKLDAAIAADAVELVDTQLRASGDAPSLLNAVGCGDKPRLARARSVAMAAKLLEHGADLAQVGRWWAEGFHVNPGVDPAVGRYLVERGALLTLHAAAGLGLVDMLAGMLDADPAGARAKGGDGCTPLCFARDTQTAALLIERGAELDARDDDHDSTPAEWLIGDSPEVARFLIEHGATPNIFLAAALGNGELAEQLIDEDRQAPAQRIGKAPWHPIGYQGRGGTILQWTLGFNCYPHQVALRKGHAELFNLLLAASDTTTQFLVACVTANRQAAERILAAAPGIVAALPPEDLELPARYCWETNVDVEAVRLMLDLGFPIDYPETSHGYTPLHNAAWGGYGDLVDLLIERGHPVDLRDPRFDSTPLGFALHCCLEDGRHPEGQYGRVVGALVDAGSPWDPSIYPTGRADLDEALRVRSNCG